MVIIDSLDQEMINFSENIWFEGSKAHSEEKGIMLESALERKWDKVCKEKNDLCEKLKDFFSKWSSRNRRPAQVENERFSKWSYRNGWHIQVKKCKDFEKWSHCNGRLVQVKKCKDFSSGEKYKDFSK
jgi:hypothetical protein